MGGQSAWLCAEPGGPGKYQLVGRLGSGGMASVYLAVACGARGFDKLVVVKMLHAPLAQDPDFIEMFLQEGRLAARLNHPNVVQTNEVIDNGTDYALVMEYLEGQTLRAWFNRARERKTFSVPMALRIMRDVLSGLHYVHELCDFDGKHLGLVHRDISPHNIFITFDGQSKVVDFGVAKAVAVSGETRRGGHKGKLRYMSPEQAKGEAVDRRADIYSIGAILWEIATGQRLWKGESDRAVMDALWIGQSPCTDLSLPPGISADLIPICRKALSPRPDDRYQCCLELQADIERVLERSTERWWSRDVGSAMRSMFDDVRRDRQSMIALQLAERGLMSAKRVSKRADALPFTPHSPDRYPQGKVPDFPVSFLETAYGSEPQSTDSDSPPVPDREGSTLVDLISTQQLEREAHGTQRSKLAAMVGALVLGFGALAIVGQSHVTFMHVSPPQVVRHAAAATAVSPAVLTEARSNVKTIHVRVWTSPPHASVTLDGKPLHGNPASGQLAADPASLHRIRVVAPGYEPRDLDVLLDDNKEILIPLSDKTNDPSPHAPQIRN